MSVLRRHLDRLRARTSGEAADLDELRAIAAGPRPWDRTTSLHITASAIVVHPPTRRVLLRWHERQQAWLQVGGHADPGETDPIEIARREAIEETGLADVRPWPDATDPAIVHAVIVPVPAGKGEPAHRHGDIRYVLATDDPAAARAEHDRAELRWLTIDAAKDLSGQANVGETLERVAALFDRFAASARPSSRTTDRRGRGSRSTDANRHTGA